MTGIGRKTILLFIIIPNNERGFHMDLQAFFKLSYGLYVISARSGEKNYGCVVNTLQQVTGRAADALGGSQQKQCDGKSNSGFRTFLRNGADRNSRICS